MNDDHDTSAVDDGTRRRLVEIAAQLDSIAASLDELSFDVLREASERRTGRPDIDRVISQARRAVEKAARLLD